MKIEVGAVNRAQITRRTKTLGQSSVTDVTEKAIPRMKAARSRWASGRVVRLSENMINIVVEPMSAKRATAVVSAFSERAARRPILAERTATTRRVPVWSVRIPRIFL